MVTLALLVAGAVLGGIFLQPARASCSTMRASVPMEMIRESGPWRCVEVPGFLIFTRLPDKHSQAFAEALRLLTLQFAALGSPPETFRAPTNQIPVVLKLVSGAGLAGARAPASPLEIYADELSLMYIAALPDVVPVQAPGTTVIPLEAILGGGPVPPGPPGSSTPAELLARDAYVRRMNYAQPPPPAWMREGLAHLMREARVGPMGVALSRAGGTTPAQEVAVEEIFTADFDEVDPWRHDALVERSELFLRWAIVIEPERRAAFWTFALQASETPPTEAMFAAAFGLSFGELGVDLTDSRLRRAQMVGGIRQPAMPPAEIRIASDEEVARLLRTAEGINQRVATHNAEVAAGK